MGDHLRLHALSIKGSEPYDVFARSAFNRYYYSAFLRVRQTLPLIGLKCPREHKSVPEYLRKTAADHVRRQARRARYLSIPKHNLGSRINSACIDIAQKLEQLNNLRKTADYEPEEYAAVQDEDVSLGGVSASQARTWTSDVHKNCDELERLWKQIDI